MTQTVRVRLRKPPRVFTFIAEEDVELSRNDTCVVKTDRGIEYGTCIASPEQATPQEQDRLKMSVMRKASHHDNTTFKQIQLDEQRAIQICREKINVRKLPMRLVESEYTFDRKKIIFYFTADDRVDFRELVKDLAFEMKARIELRHIQVRDQAKMVGGIGTCGRELCCTTWMREFLPISMKMAKRQNLSLNPTKISGQCGRLMCCLAYENELYDTHRRNRPRQEELGSIRDEMESHQREAVTALAGSEKTDVLDEFVNDAPVSLPGEFERPQSAGEDESDEGARKRRRGRRGGRGRRKKSGGE